MIERNEKYGKTFYHTDYRKYTFFTDEQLLQMFRVGIPS